MKALLLSVNSAQYYQEQTSEVREAVEPDKPFVVVKDESVNVQVYI